MALHIDDVLDEEIDFHSLSTEEERNAAEQTRQVEVAKVHILRFFADKRLHTGGQVSKAFLFKDRRLSMVMGFSIAEGVDRAYIALEELSDKVMGGLPGDTRLVLDTLNLLSRSGVPQEYAGGMLCVYLELIEGYFFAP